MKKIYIGADSAGYFMKEELIDYIKEKGYEVVDCGTNSADSCHYPEFASADSCKRESAVHAVLCEAPHI